MEIFKKVVRGTVQGLVDVNKKMPDPIKSSMSSLGHKALYKLYKFSKREEFPYSSDAEFDKIAKEETERILSYYK